jgi:hypothetical protein
MRHGLVGLVDKRHHEFQAKGDTSCSSRTIILHALVQIEHQGSLTAIVELKQIRLHTKTKVAAREERKSKVVFCRIAERSCFKNTGNCQSNESSIMQAYHESLEGWSITGIS